MGQLVAPRLLVAVLACAAAGGAAAAPGWTLRTLDSRLAFTAVQAGAEFEGQFARFEADIRFDEADLASSRFEVRIHTGSVDTGESRRDGILRGEEFFWVERHPDALFEAIDFSRSGGDFLARGTLSLRGVSRPVPVRFTFERLPDGGARLTGSAELNRLDFGVGQGEWKSTQWIGARVGISFSLRLAR